MDHGEGSYLSDEMFEGLDYRAIRDKALDFVPELGSTLLDNSATATAYAADSAGEGLSLQDFLRDRAETRVENEAARFIRYELVESIRSRSITDLDEENYFQAALVDGDLPVENLQRAFFLIDREQGGYIDIRPDDVLDDVEPSRYPTDFSQETSEEDYLKPLDESDVVTQEDLGQLNLSGIYVMNDDWIMYRNDRQPLGVDSEVREDVHEFLEELGVARTTR